MKHNKEQKDATLPSARVLQNPVLSAVSEFPWSGQVKDFKVIKKLLSDRYEILETNVKGSNKYHELFINKVKRLSDGVIIERGWDMVFNVGFNYYYGIMEIFPVKTGEYYEPLKGDLFANCVNHKEPMGSPYRYKRCCLSEIMNYKLLPLSQIDVLAE